MSNGLRIIVLFENIFQNLPQRSKALDLDLIHQLLILGLAVFMVICVCALFVIKYLTTQLREQQILMRQLIQPRLESGNSSFTVLILSRSGPVQPNLKT